VCGLKWNHKKAVSPTSPFLLLHERIPDDAEELLVHLDDTFVFDYESNDWKGELLYDHSVFGDD
jgi:hypothetical protein